MPTKCENVLACDANHDRFAYAMERPCLSKASEVRPEVMALGGLDLEQARTGGLGHGFEQVRRPLLQSISMAQVSGETYWLKYTYKYKGEDSRRAGRAKVIEVTREN